MSGIDIGLLFEKSKELDQLRKEQEDAFQEINKFHKKLQSTPEMFDTIIGRLRPLYALAKELSENEVSALTALMGQLDALLQSGHSAPQRKKIDEQKKKRMKPDADLIRFPSTASVRSQLEHAASLKGEQVAGRLKLEDDEKDEWFVVKVIRFDKDAKEFEVLDEDPGEGEENALNLRKYTLPMSDVIPFPKKGDPSSAPDFPPGRHVLAVYPGTTALYKATVVNPHRKRKSDDYLLEFDDDEEDGSLPQRNVPFHKVVPLPEGHRQGIS